MNKSFIKFLTDFGPLVIFFYFYYDSGKDLKIAIPPFIVATLLALAIMWVLEKTIPKVLSLFSGVFLINSKIFFILDGKMAKKSPSIKSSKPIAVINSVNCGQLIFLLMA